MKHLSLRIQVIIIAATLAIGGTGAIVVTANAIKAAEENIVRINLDRLRSVATELARRYGSVMDFIAPDQLDDPSLVNRTEINDLLTTITREELLNYEDATAGFYHPLGSGNLALVNAPYDTSVSAPVDRFLRALTQNSIDQLQEQSGHYESADANFIAAAMPVYARQRLVGVAWARDNLADDLEGSWRLDLTPLLQALVLFGIALAGLFVFYLRREVNGIQTGLETMKQNLFHRLPFSRTEFGNIAGSINHLAETIVEQQREKERMQEVMKQNERLAALGELTAGIAHEIRTPLSLIKTRVQLWQQGRKRTGTGLRSKTRVTPESMTMVVEELDRMDGIVQKLLLFSKRRSLSFQNIDLHEFLDSTITLLRREFRKKRIRVVTEYSAPIANIKGAPTELRGVFLNLLMNSLEASPNGGTITVRTNQPGNTSPFLQVVVEDMGKGIQREHAGKIFDPFFTTKETGVGLGLSIAHEITRFHRGTLEYAPATTGGAKFTVTLPLEL